jgi:hypothetical protein
MLASGVLVSIKHATVLISAILPIGRATSVGYRLVTYQASTVCTLA